jgi:hypothetical protein
MAPPRLSGNWTKSSTGRESGSAAGPQALQTQSSAASTISRPQKEIAQMSERT